MKLNFKNKQYDVVIIGAGPSGALAGAMLASKGFSVLILEQQQFPRFSIGESLLPQCMEFLKSADLVSVIEEQADNLGFQFKNGAAFHKSDINTAFDFNEKFSDGPGTTFQVKRASFDKLLADQAEIKGVEILYGHKVEKVISLEPQVILKVVNSAQEGFKVKGRFLLDASGFGRVLPRLLKLELPSNFPVRQSFFCHFSDHIEDDDFDRNKILVTVHPQYQDVWYWLIPFSDGTASVGVIGTPEYFSEQLSPAEILIEFIQQAPNLKVLLKNATIIPEVRTIKGYSSDVKQLSGENYALLGNAGEFLDPVFSSGVTIALKSAALAVPLVEKQLQGQKVDWFNEYAQPLKFGVDTFRSFVEAWYDGSFQDIIFHGTENENVTRMLSSILAGYAWDNNNPYVAKSAHRLAVLAQVCRS